MTSEMPEQANPPSEMPDQKHPPTGNEVVSRRSLLRVSAWAAPVLVVAAAAPAAVASVTDLGRIQILGTCGNGPLVGNGFDVTAELVRIPVGTTITLVANGIAGLAWDISRPGDVVSIVDDQTTAVVLTRPILENETLSLRATLSVGVFLIITGTITLPTGYIASGGKLVGTLEWTTFGVCDAH